MPGRVLIDEDAWRFKKWKIELNAGSLMEATLPPSVVEDEEDIYELLYYGGRGVFFFRIGQKKVKGLSGKVQTPKTL